MNVFDMGMLLVYVLVAYLVFKIGIYWIDKFFDGGKKK